MTTLSRKDTRTLGYFCVGSTMLCLALDACFEWHLGWLGLMFACNGMLGVALIAEGTAGPFAVANRPLYRMIGVGIGLPPIVLTIHRWCTRGWSLSIDLVGLLIPLTVVAVFVWYMNTHDAAEDRQATHEELPGTGSENEE